MGADFNSHVSLRDITHPNLPSFREGVIFPPSQGGLKVGADFNFQVAPSGYHPSPTFPQKGRSYFSSLRDSAEQKVTKCHVL